MVFGFLRKKSEKRGSNPNSQANLQRGPPAPSELTLLSRKLDELEKRGNLAEQAMGLAERLGGLPSESEGSGFDSGGLADILDSDVVKLIVPVILPYLPGIIEKFGGVQASAVNIPSSSSGDLPPGQLEQPTTPGDASGSIKTALALPDELWTGDNIRKTLAPYGLGNLSDEDLNRLGKKLSKV